MLNTSLCFNSYSTDSQYICFDSCDNGLVSGRLAVLSVKKSMDFSSVMELINGVEYFLDNFSVVERNESPRLFSGQSYDTHKDVLCSDLNGLVSGRLATFCVNIKFRQNSTWQGEAVWLETGKKESFRSALELLIMLDRALCSIQNR
ncbi:hypothetical protein MUJ63_02325 [Lachnospiraceae bacterium NSJ-143]|nr:hypothetical protein [Lachnospiraceae bacterium NSJ-143]